MEELFDTIAWETQDTTAKPSEEPLWARVCALSGGTLLMAVGLFFMWLGVMIGLER